MSWTKRRLDLANNPPRYAIPAGAIYRPDDPPFDWHEGVIRAVGLGLPPDHFRVLGYPFTPRHMGFTWWGLRWAEIVWGLVTRLHPQLADPALMWRPDVPFSPDLEVCQFAMTPSLWVWTSRDVAAEVGDCLHNKPIGGWAVRSDRNRQHVPEVLHETSWMMPRWMHAEIRGLHMKHLSRTLGVNRDTW